MKKVKVSNLVAILAVIVIVVCISPTIYAKIKWNIEFKEYQNREYETCSATLKEAVENGYYEDVDMAYVVQDGIGVKVDSLIITDDYFESKINFKFADEVQVHSDEFRFGYAVYDDENNIYCINTIYHDNAREDKYTPFLYQELGVEYDRHDMYGIQLCQHCGFGLISANPQDRTIVEKIDMDSFEGFPKSKKMYIRIFDLGYEIWENVKTGEPVKPEQIKDVSISDKEWIFEIEVPEKFYERETTELKLKDDIPGVEIEKMEVSEIGLVVKAKIERLGEVVATGKDISPNEWRELSNETINIKDEEENMCFERSMKSEGDEVKIYYDINKNTLNKKLFFNVKINGQQYTSEIVKK